MEQVAYLKSLSKKICSVGALFFDDQGRLLVLETSYKKGWTIPGGVVDSNESLLEGLKREIGEEIGLDVSVKKLLVIEYKSGKVKEYFSESLQFIFFGGILSKEGVEDIKVDGEEIVAFEFMEVNSALSMLGENLSRRVRVALDNIESSEVAFMDNGEKIV
ncbi:NUDIX domain-containing protein [Patescibacteria group bacterium]